MPKENRREVRLSQRDDDLIVEAAGIVGVSVSEFVLDRAIADAERTVEVHHSVALDAAAYRRFLAVLDSPTPPPEALSDQVRRARALKHVG